MPAASTARVRAATVITRSRGAVSHDGDQAASQARSPAAPPLAAAAVAQH